ncbi:hypothetical protein J7T55_002194 [Diaporthe amygdali]|uniref:uncharacterized protein n=1 Tax=Phomopsis amygdali TaxID=1214568 RepID=UPI0022FE8A5D|nr:uncharacterized protein J7T55_002194 [Diaporthe amygdali]KAJ0103775.1 hypothetical protein J7T55_002194 [Diaporthe amygdali]
MQSQVGFVLSFLAKFAYDHPNQDLIVASTCFSENTTTVLPIRYRASLCSISPNSASAPMAHATANSTPSHDTTRPGTRGVLHQNNQERTSKQTSTRLPRPLLQLATYLPSPASTPDLNKRTSCVRVGHRIVVNSTRRFS